MSLPRRQAAKKKERKKKRCSVSIILNMFGCLPLKVNQEADGS